MTDEDCEGEGTANIEDNVPRETVQRFEVFLVWTRDRFSHISDESTHTFEKITSGVVELTCFERCFERLAMDPHSQIRMFWEFLGFLAIATDVVTVPLQVFDPPTRGVVEVMMWTSQMYWNMDIAMNFLTGYYQDGFLMMQPYWVARHYMRGWFAFDCMLVTCDWGIFVAAALVQDAKGGTDAAVARPTARVAKGLRMLRYLRMVRMLRIAKFAQFMGVMNDMMSMDLTVVRFGMAKVCVAVLLGTHLVACGWYGLGRLTPYQVSACTTWIRAWRGPDHTIADWGPCPHDLNDESELLTLFAQRYTVSLLWSTTQLGFGSFDRTQPQNWAENIYSIGVAIISLFIVSGIVGGITSSILRVLSSKADELRQFELLRRFCRQRNVPLELSSRIYRFAQDVYRERQGKLVISSVELIEVLSEPLRAELHYYMYLEFFELQPLLRVFCTKHVTTMHRVAACALSIEVLAAGDTLFVQRTLSDATRCVEAGVSQYRRRRRQQTVAHAHTTESQLPSDSAWEVVERGQWICGAAIFCAWMHVGTLRALTDGRVIRIDSASFSRSVQNDMQPWKAASDHATSFVRRLNSTQRRELSDLDRGPANTADLVDPKFWWHRQTQPGSMGG